MSSGKSVVKVNDCINATSSGMSIVKVNDGSCRLITTIVDVILYQLVLSLPIYSPINTETNYFLCRQKF